MKQETKQKIAKEVTKRWQKPEFREKMLEKQKALGLRNYPSGN